jgi:hypothetical protein
MFITRTGAKAVASAKQVLVALTILGSTALIFAASNQDSNKAQAQINPPPPPRGSDGTVPQERIAKCQAMRRDVRDWTSERQAAYQRLECWHKIEADNGAVYQLDLGLIQRFADGASSVVYTDEGGVFNPMNMKQWFFNCQGHFSVTLDRGSTPMTYAAPRSVAARISNLVCVGASVKKSRQGFEDETSSTIPLVEASVPRASASSQERIIGRWSGKGNGKSKSFRVEGAPWEMRVTSTDSISGTIYSAENRKGISFFGFQPPGERHPLTSPGNQYFVITTKGSWTVSIVAQKRTIAFPGLILRSELSGASSIVPARPSAPYSGAIWFCVQRSTEKNIRNVVTLLAHQTGQQGLTWP